MYPLRKNYRKDRVSTHDPDGSYRELLTDCTAVYTDAEQIDVMSAYERVFDKIAI